VWRGQWALSPRAAAPSDLQQRVAQANERVRVTAVLAQKKDRWAASRDRETRDRLLALDAWVDVQFVDLDAEPEQARRLGIRSYGVWVVEAGDQRVEIEERRLFRVAGEGEAKRLEFIGEQALRSAIGRVLSKEQRTLYLLTGHGESHGRLLVERAELRGMGVQNLDLITDGPAVPEDASLVWVDAPRVPFSLGEEQAIEAYLERGGRLYVSLEPGGFTPKFVEKLGLVLEEGVLLDTQFYAPFVERPLVQWRPHPLVLELMTLRPMVSGAGALAKVRDTDRGLRPLLGSSEGSWMEVKQDGVYSPDLETQARREVVWTADWNESRVLVAADANLFSDELFAEGAANLPLLDATLAWLDGEIPTITVGEPVDQPLVLSAAQLRGFWWFFLVIWPSVPLVVGAAWLWRRR